MENNRKDQIILQQLELIRNMTEHNLRRSSLDFWGAPDTEKKAAAPAGENVPGAGEHEPPTPAGKTAASTGVDETKAPAVEQPAPPEPIEELKAELESYIGLAGIKREVETSSIWSPSTACARSMTCRQQSLPCIWCLLAIPVPARP